MASPQYITIDDLKNAVDIRDLKALTSDTGADAVLDANNGPLVQSIEWASSEFLRSVVVGGRYTAAQMLTLSTDDDFAIKGPVIDLATYRLFARRTGKGVPDEVEQRYKKAQEVLDQLRRGYQVLPIEAATAAGDPVVSFPTTTEIEAMDLVSNEDYFPKFPFQSSVPL